MSTKPISAAASWTTDKAVRATRVVPALLKQMNARRVLDALWRLSHASRAELSRYTGISAPTMSKLVDHLERTGLLERLPELQLTEGRPSVIYKLATTQSGVLGAVIDVHECTVLATGLDGKIDEKKQITFPTPETYDTLITKLTAQLLKLRPAGRKQPCFGVGISVPGLINATENRVVFSPNLHYTDARHPGRDLAERLKLPTFMVHEPHGLCLAEQMFGAARTVDHFAMVDITEGLGLGVVTGGRYLSGFEGYGGELGHITVQPEGEYCGCGNRGCLETLATDRAVARAISKKLGRTLDIQQVTTGIQSGDIHADAELDRTLEYLAIGLAVVINLFNPEVIFINGHFFGARHGLFDELVSRTQRRALTPSAAHCQIIQSRGSKPLGAIAAVLDHICNALGPSFTRT